MRPPGPPWGGSGGQLLPALAGDPLEGIMRFMRSALLAAGLAAFATPAWAGHCPQDHAALSAALAANTSLSPEMRMVVQTLLDRGIQLHPANHAAALGHLHTAAVLLGIVPHG